MFSIIHRIFLLVVFTLSVGFIVNQFYSEGIRWVLLKPQFADSDTQKYIQFISADSAFALHISGEAFFVDTRIGEEYEIDHVPGALSIPLFSYYKSPEILDPLDKNTAYILYCFEPECKDAGSLAAEFVDKGFRNVSILYGGFSEWLEKGYPVE